MTSIPDIINASFESLAGLMIILHCKRVLKDKCVKGVSILATCFFAAWGFWNLYYYPFLGQWWSFVGGISVFTANCIWIGLMIYYKNKGA
jgi:hypothetical protein